MIQQVNNTRNNPFYSVLRCYYDIIIFSFLLIVHRFSVKVRPAVEHCGRKIQDFACDCTASLSINNTFFEEVEVFWPIYYLYAAYLMLIVSSKEKKYAASARKGCRKLCSRNLSAQERQSAPDEERLCFSLLDIVNS